MESYEAAEILKKRLTEKADDIIVSVNDEETSQIKISDSKISTTKNWQVSEISVFAAVDKRIITTSLKEFSRESISDAVDSVVKFARAIKPNHEYCGIAEGPFPYRDTEDGYDPRIVSLTNEEKIDFLEGAVNTALSAGARRVAGIFELTHRKNHILTSNNIDAEDRDTNAYLSLRSLVDKFATGHKMHVARIFSKLRADWVARRSAEIAVDSQNPQSGPKGKFDVVFDPLPYSNILNQVGNAASAFYVDSGLSCFKGAIGKRVASSCLTLADDGTLPNGLASSKYDAEGRPSQKTILIERGVLKTYLHNTSTAKRYKTASTANAGLIAPEPTNLVLSGGDRSRDELISDVKKGLYLTNTWYTRFQNHQTGDFSTIPRDGAFYIKNGKIMHPVKDIRVSDNIIRILKNSVELANDAIEVVGWEVETPCVCPSVLVKGVNISRSA
ncbi:MAG: TldD/PmbA family protein [archaeon]